MNLCCQISSQSVKPNARVSAVLQNTDKGQ